MVWDKTKPATNSALVSADVRANWAAIETAFGPPDAATLSQVATQFAVPPTFKPGTATTYDATVNGKILFDHTQKNGATGAGTDCVSGTISANAIQAAGKMLRLVAHGTLAANANNKTLTFTFGGTVFFTFPTVAANAYNWTLKIELARTSGSAAQTMNYEWAMSPSATGATIYKDRATAAKDLTAAQTIKITIISGTASGDITFDWGYVEVIG